MKSIHVVYGNAPSARTACAMRLAARRPKTLVHEIDGSNDLSLLISGRYEHMVAILKAGDEANARRQFGEIAARAHADAFAVTFEQASRPL